MTLTYVALAAAALGLILLLVAGPAYRLGVPLEAAFSILRWGGYTGALGVTLGMVASFVAYRRRQRLPMAIAIVACVLGVVAVVIPSSWQRRARTAPPIHDITTDLDNPPTFEAVVPLRAESPNTLDRPPLLAGQQRDGYPDIAPVTLPLPPDRVFNRSLDVAQRLGWEIVAANQASGRIEATDTTRWFGFKDDVAVRITAWGSGTRVDVRSVSRVGRSDLGTNARRIREFLEALQEQ